jgi:hypothetical protein
VQASRPVVLTGAVSGWPAVRKWSLGYFKREFGDRRLPVFRERDRSPYDIQRGLNYEHIRLGDYCDLVGDEKPHDLYMTVRVHEALPELFDDISAPVYTAGARWTRSRLWLGGPQARGPLHRDLPENLYAQIAGRKQFFLLDRRLTHMVHRHRLLSGVPNYSPVDTEQPDLSCHPRFRGAPLWRAVVEPGDLLYIPRLWWHQARSLTTSIGVNLWWLRGPMVVVARLAERYMRLRGLQL